MDAAIWARDVNKTYGGKHEKFVLKKFNMTVQKGTLYGLLGASGCGKTTLLSAIVGSRPINSGQISVLGRTPDPAYNSNIGYMPQDIALANEFSVRGAIYHFGWLYGVPNTVLEERFDFLSEILDLPSSGKLIKNLSGGQQRRVSLAAALVHDPEILILDEPTVGQDPVLRQNIWDYLVQLTRDEKKTIILTTHYIEEAGQADTVGLLRNGRLLWEGSPTALMDKYESTSIEEVFLVLSKKQVESPPDSSYSNLDDIAMTDFAEIDSTEQKLLEPPPFSVRGKIRRSLLFTNYDHSKALLSKNITKLVRDRSTLFVCCIFPILEISMFLLAVGGDFNTLNFGVVNPEMAPYRDCQEFADANVIGATREPGGSRCNYNGLACKFLLGLPQHLAHYTYFNDSQEAKMAMLSSEITGFYEFHANYSIQLGKLKEFEDLSKEDVEELQINIDIDRSNYPVIIHVKQKIAKRYVEFSQEMEEECGYSGRIGGLPMRMMDAVYGKYDAPVSETMTPGYIISLTFFNAVIVSSLTIVTEKLDGSWDRTQVSGVSTTEIIIFHFITMSIFNFLQNIMMFVTTFFIFDWDSYGSLVTAFFLITLQGFVGIAMGTFISAVSRSVNECNSYGLGVFLPFTLFSGTFWPLEGMPDWLRYLSYVTPSTMSCEAMANSMNRGWEIYDMGVAKGVIISIAWCIAFIAMSTFIIKREKS